MARISIQRRLLVTVVLSQLLLAFGLVGGSIYLNRRLLRRAFDNALRERAMSVAALVRYSEENPPRLIFESDLVPPALEQNRPDLYQVTTTDGVMIARSADLPCPWKSDDARPASYCDFTFAGVGYRELRIQVPVFDREPDVHTHDVLIVSYASPLDELNHQVLMAGIYTGIGTAILLLLGVAFATWGLRRGLRPLSDLADSAALVSPAHWELDAGAEALNTTELVPLTDAMRSMLEGLHHAFNQQREFVANAAHELKTPVAILKSTLQLLLQWPRTSEQYRAGLEQALMDLDRLENLLHAMLRLARAEQATAEHRGLEVVELASSCQSALDALSMLARERGVRLDFTPDGTASMRADPEDLRLIWCNLLENAIGFSPAGGKVNVRVCRDGDRGRVEIEDDGPGIADADLPRVFDRFYRGDHSRTRDTGGYGLGLAIAKALVEAYGGSISAQHGQTDGTKMVVLFPVSQSALPASSPVPSRAVAN